MDGRYSRRGGRRGCCGGLAGYLRSRGFEDRGVVVSYRVYLLSGGFVGAVVADLGERSERGWEFEALGCAEEESCFHSVGNIQSLERLKGI